MTSHVTMSDKTIHNPAEPRHFMRIKPIAGRITIRRCEEVLATSDRALRLLEVGKDVYDPTIYLPHEDVNAALTQTDKSTHCPLKGDAVYFDAAGVTEIAWAYPDPLDIAPDLKGRVAFYASKVSITETPLD